MDSHSHGFLPASEPPLDPPEPCQERYRIHFEHADGTEDSFVVEGSLEACIEMARKGVKQRKGKNPWSELIS